MNVNIVDYGVGNLFSLTSSLRRIGASSKIATSPSQLHSSDALILPGVGNFSSAAKGIEPFKPAIYKFVRDERLPLLGICLGMQLLFEGSEEGEGLGLGLLEGRVISLPNLVKRPHMGWNSLQIVRKDGLLRGIGDGTFVYFNHSYYPLPSEDAVTSAKTTYGVTFSSIVSEANVYGTQFHPEKSGSVGEKILRNFIGLSTK